MRENVQKVGPFFHISIPNRSYVYAHGDTYTRPVLLVRQGLFWPQYTVFSVGATSIKRSNRGLLYIMRTYDYCCSMSTLVARLTAKEYVRPGTSIYTKYLHFVRVSMKVRSYCSLLVRRIESNRHHQAARTRQQHPILEISRGGDAGYHQSRPLAFFSLSITTCLSSCQRLLLSASDISSRGSSLSASRRSSL